MYEIELEIPSQPIYIFEVSEVKFTTKNGAHHMEFIGLDPENCSDSLKELFNFHPEDNTAVLVDKEAIEHLSIGPV